MPRRRISEAFTFFFVVQIIDLHSPRNQEHNIDYCIMEGGTVTELLRLNLDCCIGPGRRRAGRRPRAVTQTRREAAIHGTLVGWNHVAERPLTCAAYCESSASDASVPASPTTTFTSTVSAKCSTPEHVGIIMDGNGRWAAKRGAVASVGHKAGIDALQRTVEGCVELGVRFLSVFALSTENSANRAVEEVSFLIRLVRSVVNDRLDKLHAEGVKLRFIGNLEGIGDSQLLEVIQNAERLTAGNDTLTLTVALNFSGTDDIVRTTRALAQRVLDGSIDVEDIDTIMISSSLSMGYIDRKYREPDLLIRTGGEQRVSNFLLFEIAYTELYFSDVLWPDWDFEALKEACADYGMRERRFGG